MKPNMQKTMYRRELQEGKWNSSTHRDEPYGAPSMDLNKQQNWSRRTKVSNKTLVQVPRFASSTGLHAYADTIGKKHIRNR